MNEKEKSVISIRKAINTRFDVDFIPDVQINIGPENFGILSEESLNLNEIDAEKLFQCFVNHLPRHTLELLTKKLMREEGVEVE